MRMKNLRCVSGDLNLLEVTRHDLSSVHPASFLLT